MIEGHQKCLRALDEATEPNGLRCCHFIVLQLATKYDRKTVRRYVRALARKGLAEYFRGLWDDDGCPAGAGYCITYEGRAALKTENNRLRQE